MLTVVALGNVFQVVESGLVEAITFKPFTVSKKLPADLVQAFVTSSAVGLTPHETATFHPKCVPSYKKC